MRLEQILDFERKLILSNNASIRIIKADVISNDDSGWYRVETLYTISGPLTRTRTSWYCKLIIDDSNSLILRSLADNWTHELIRVLGDNQCH